LVASEAKEILLAALLRTGIAWRIAPCLKRIRWMAALSFLSTQLFFFFFHVGMIPSSFLVLANITGR
jgi:hypothetical protein